MPSEILNKARAYEAKHGAAISPAERPAYHMTPYVGWLNDPNGFSYYKGKYHQFYQYNPYDVRWAPMHWGHAVSTDLLHWEYLPCALAPDSPADNGPGCFSGSATEMDDGKQLLMYTSVIAEKQPNGEMRDIQTQSIAIGDGLDYEKPACNPVLTQKDLPEGFSKFDFRDPKIWREADGTYSAVTVCLAEDGSGAAALFQSKDGFDWHFVTVLERCNNQYGKMWAHLPMLLTDMNARCFSIVFQPSEEDSALLEGHLENAQRMIEQQGQQRPHGDFAAHRHVGGHGRRPVSAAVWRGPHASRARLPPHHVHIGARGLGNCRRGRVPFLPRHGLTPRDGVPSQLSLAQIVRHIGIGRLPALAKVHGYVLSRTNVRHRRTVRRVGDATMAQWVRVRFAIDMRRVPAAGSAIHPRAAVDRHSAMPDKAAADHGGRRRGVERGAVAQRCVVASMGVRRSHARLADDLQPVDAADASQRADRPRSGVRHRLS